MGVMLKLCVSWGGNTQFSATFFTFYLFFGIPCVVPSVRSCFPHVPRVCPADVVQTAPIAEEDSILTLVSIWTKPKILLTVQ